VTNVRAQLPDPLFTFSNYRQSAAPVGDGAFGDFDALTVSVRARRHASMSAAFLVLPLCLVTGAVCLALFLDPASSVRISIPVSAASATMAFSFVVSTACPPVGYATRAHLLVLQAYAFAVAQLLETCYVRTIILGVEELDAAQAVNRRLIKDAIWASERLGPADAGDVLQDTGLPQKASGQAPPSEPTFPPPVATKLYIPAEAGEDSAAPVDLEKQRVGDMRCIKVSGGGMHHGRGAESYSELNAELNADWLDTSAALLNGGVGGVEVLLGSAEVRRFIAGARWGARPVSILGGLGLVTDANAAAWRAHVARVDELARAALLPLAAGTLSVVLGVETLGFLTGPLSPAATRLA
jgi:hypothetical protein